MTKQHALYVILFSDDRLKVGITACTKKRMQYYRQEARRNFVPAMFWWACAPFADKQTALIAETHLCRTYSDFAIKGHREWFRAGKDGYAAVIAAAESVRALLGDEDEIAKLDLPWQGTTGHFTGLAV